MKARVFLSCGQTRETNEPEIAGRIAERIRHLGFDCYVAIQIQSLRGLRENIFKELESSEYFIFVDFKRERISSREIGDETFRGSLFSHQELGVASFLDTPCLILQESGVKERDGMLSCLQANAHTFSDRNSLPDQVERLVRKNIESGDWSSSCRNLLTMLRPMSDYTDAWNPTAKVTYRNFHIEVRNNHRNKIAQNCYAILESITNEESGITTPQETVEFKWAGTRLPSVFIAAGTSRRFDALKVKKNDPKEILFNSFCDSFEFRPKVPGFGTYLLQYGVYSSNFPPVHSVFKLNHHGDLASISIEDN